MCRYANIQGGQTYLRNYMVQARDISNLHYCHWNSSYINALTIWVFRDISPPSHLQDASFSSFYAPIEINNVSLRIIKFCWGCNFYATRNNSNTSLSISTRYGYISNRSACRFPLTVSKFITRLDTARVYLLICFAKLNTWHLC